MMETIIRIDIAKDFGKYPGGRYLSQGKFSGERFREEFLVSHLKENKYIEIILDGTIGYIPLPINSLKIIESNLSI